MTDLRPVLLGMNNPLSRHPEDALVPWPVGCTGHRIWRMICDARVAKGLSSPSEEDYVTAFDRRNLVAGQEWSLVKGRESAKKLWTDAPWRGRTLVVLGAEVPKILFGEVPEPLRWHAATTPVGPRRWVHVPHPSGRNRWYNVPGNRARAASLLAEVYEEGRKCL